MREERFPGRTQNFYDYDKTDNLASLTDAGGTVSYGYTDDNLLKSVTEPGGFQTSFTYDPDRDERELIEFPNGVQVTQDFDEAGRIQQITGERPSTGATFSGFTYTYRDATGRETALRQSVTDKDGNETVYSYDHVDRLKRAETTASGGGLVSDYKYDYDAASNRVKQTVGTAETSYAYNNANQLSQAGSRTYSYDLNGNETGNSSGRALGYNAFDQTTSITPAGGSAQSLTYGDAGQSELRSAGSESFRDNVLGLGVRTAGGTSTYYTRTETGEPLGQRVGGARQYFLKDALGSIVGITDSSGALVRSYEYDPFGNPTGGSGSASSVLRFAGGHLTLAGLYHFGERYYDPEIGRWTQQDPLNQYSDLKQANRYVYVGQDPVNVTDPTGLQAPGCHYQAWTGREICPPEIDNGPFGGFVDRLVGGAVGCVRGAFTGILRGRSPLQGCARGSTWGSAWEAEPAY